MPVLLCVAYILSKGIPMRPQVDGHRPILIRQQTTRLAFLLLVIVVWIGACAPVPSRAPAPAPERRTVAEVLDLVAFVLVFASAVVQLARARRPALEGSGL